MAAWAQSSAKEPAVNELWAEFPRQNPSLVREVVGASHRDEAKVRELVERSPALARATWDWGFGDWETALGAASHTGQRGIAEYLLSRGARIDIFAAAMLGMTDVVKAFVAASPGIQRTPGPHGIPLLAHAQAGGKEAEATLAYLESLGDAGVATQLKAIDDAQRLVYAGRYGFDLHGPTYFEVKINKGRLELTREADTARQLHCVGEHEFFPAGAPAVRVRFTVEGGKSTAVTVVDHRELLTAKRIAS